MARSQHPVIRHAVTLTSGEHDRRATRWPLFASELIGTAMLVLAGLSFVILDFGAGSPVARVVPGEAVRRFITGFLFGATGACIALSPVGKVSGAHLNPVVTLGFWLWGKLDGRTALTYVAGQLVGGIAGCWPLLGWGAMGRSVDFGATVPGAGWSTAAALFGEMVTTFTMVMLLSVFLGFRGIRRFTPLLFPLRGSVVRWLGTGTDVTEQREAERRKDEFLAMLSHELRNPLAPIRNCTNILRRSDPTSEQARRARGVIERQSAHLGRLVDDLLDFTRIARGKIELRRLRVDLRDVAMRAADDVQTLMQERGLELCVDVPPAPVWADADATRVTQVIGNLLHNAAKFTSRGGTVELAVRRVNDLAEISVRDTGAGIDAALLPHLFDAFVQGERTRSRSEGGLGLGLALVKGIAELHGGSVRAESAGIGEGATVMVRLPLAEAGASHAPGPLGRDGRIASSHVLVVDDNRDGADSLAELLTLLGHHVHVAYDGLSALEKIRTDPPNVVVCDLGLPDISGYSRGRFARRGATSGSSR